MATATRTTRRPSKACCKSWHNFFFVSFDPGGFRDRRQTTTWLLDSDRQRKDCWFPWVVGVFLAPQALAGVLSVLGAVSESFAGRSVLLRGGHRCRRDGLAITPVAVADNRNNTIDSLLVLTLLLFAAWATLRATENGRLRWLLLAMALVGVVFNIKMLQAYLVLPALRSRSTCSRRCSSSAGLHAYSPTRSLPASCLLVVSLLLGQWPSIDACKQQRPYVGLSQHNSEIQLAFGYNGVQRLLGMVFGHRRLNQRLVQHLAIDQRTTPGGPGGVSENGAPGFFRLLNAQLGGQVSWLLALGVDRPAARAGWGIRWNAAVARTRTVALLASTRRRRGATPI